MRTSITLAVAATTFLGARAIRLVERTDGSPPKVVEHTIQRKHVADPLQHDRNRMRKRADPFTVSLDNEETLYFMNASIGTPAQSFRLHIDTGSSDLWVNSADSRLCSNRGNGCDISGTYDANSSSTYNYINSDFTIVYVDGSGSAGDYVSDTVAFGGITLDDQQFGIGYQSSSPEGVLGIGYPFNEVAVQFNHKSPYANVPQNLVDSGHINTNAYSLWLNDLEASTGSILFGGVNSDKYTGSLETLPIVKEVGTYAEFIIALTAVGANGTAGSIASDIAVPALLDSGSSLMYLPDDITQQIYDTFGAQYDTSQNAAFVDCDLANSDATIEFTFSSPTISVAMSELILVAGVDRGEFICILGIGPAGDSTPVLGDTFLRSAYVVYDIDNNEISLAQTNFNSTSDDIKEISADSGVPDATVVPNAVTNVAIPSDGGARIDSGGPFTSILDGAAQATPAPAAWNLAAIGAAAGAAAMFAL